MNKKTTTPKAWLHGECIIQESILPSEVKAVQLPMYGEKAAIIAASEVTGNHHVIDMVPGINFFEEASSLKRFVQNSVPMTVRCVMADRHTEVVVPPGTYHLGVQQEYDYVKEQLIKVRD